MSLNLISNKSSYEQNPSTNFSSDYDFFKTEFKNLFKPVLKNKKFNHKKHDYDLNEMIEHTFTAFSNDSQAQNSAEIINSFFEQNVDPYKLGIHQPNIVNANHWIAITGDLDIPTPTYIYTKNDINDAYLRHNAAPTKISENRINACLAGNLLSKQFSSSTLFVRIKTDKQLQAVSDDLKAIKNATTVDLDLIDSVTDLLDNNVDESIITLYTGKVDMANENIIKLIAKSVLTNGGQVLPITLSGYLNPIAISIIVDDRVLNTSEQAFNNEIRAAETAYSKYYKFITVTLKSIKSSKKVAKQLSKVQASGTAQKDPSKHQSRALTQLRLKYTNEKTRLDKLVKIINSKAIQIQSQNTYKTTKRTYMRPNRRNPNSLSLQGTVKKTAYRPDVHIFLDTSGSISEDMYHNAVSTAAMLTKKLKSNLYISSFATNISQPILIKSKNINQVTIAKTLNDLPKVGGGTRFTNVWLQIDQIAKQNTAQRINIIITDYEYYLSYDDYFNPTAPSCLNTYYLAINNKSQAKHIELCSRQLAKSMIARGFKRANKHMIL